jgi:hypothetical protein
MDEKQALDEILKRGYKDLRLRFISDGDSRPQGGMHPFAHLWDNGEDSIGELENLLAIRKDALEGFSESNIRPGRPMATLEEVLVPVYFLHRYQVEAVSKLVAGVEYEYQLREGWQNSPSIISGDVQRKALEALIHTIEPQNLRIPDRVLQLIPPRPPAYPESRELFRGYSGLAFDPIAAAESASELTISLLLNPQRAARLTYFSSVREDYPSLGELINRLVEATWQKTDLNGIEAEINRTTSFVLLNHLLLLATSQASSAPVKAIVHSELKDLRDFMLSNYSEDAKQEAAQSLGADLIEHYLRNPNTEYRPKIVPPPPGSPIGSCGF